LLAVLLVCVGPQLATADVCMCNHTEWKFPSTNIYRLENLYMVAYGMWTIIFLLLPNAYHVPWWHPDMVVQMAQKTCTITRALIVQYSIELCLCIININIFVFQKSNQLLLEENLEFNCIGLFLLPRKTSSLSKPS